MKLLEKIQSDLTFAMKSKSEKELGSLRMLVAAIKNEEINKRPKPLEESDIASVIKKEVKKLKDGAEQFRSGGRNDLAEQYEEEIKILSKYLPEEAGEDEIRKAAREKIAASADKNFGIIMKQVMAEFEGKADGSLVSKIVKEELGS